MKKAILYINQFFGSVGGEDQADFEPVLKAGAVGPGLALQATLHDCEITHTIICGDNYMNSHRDEAIKRIDEFLQDKELDIFFAGPAFQSGRYGMSCGEICKYVTDTYHIPCITCMNEENPGVDAYRSNLFYILKGNKSAAKMRSDVKVMTALANKLLNGEEIGWAEAEGYFSRGIRKEVFVQKTPVDRAVDMLLAKLNGQPYDTEFKIELVESVTPAAAVDPKKANIALITTGSLVPVGNPDRIPSGTASIWKKYDISQLDTFRAGEFYSVHGGFSTNNVNADPEVLVPLAQAKQLMKEGLIGQLHPEYYVTTGNLTIVKEAVRMGREMAADLLAQHVDACIFVST